MPALIMMTMKDKSVVAYIRSSAIFGLQMIMLARGSCSTCKDVSRRETHEAKGHLRKLA